MEWFSLHTWAMCGWDDFWGTSWPEQYPGQNKVMPWLSNIKNVVWGLCFSRSFGDTPRPHIQGRLLLPPGGALWESWRSGIPSSVRGVPLILGFPLISCPPDMFSSHVGELGGPSFFGRGVTLILGSYSMILGCPPILKPPDFGVPHRTCSPCIWGGGRSWGSPILGGQGDLGVSSTLVGCYKQLIESWLLPYVYGLWITLWVIILNIRIFSLGNIKTVVYVKMFNVVKIVWL